MKAILLAAGRGTRISRYLDGNPKCTVDLGNGTKLIEYSIAMLKKKGITEIALVTGYRHRVIEDVLKGANVKFFYNPFYDVTNSLASLWFAKEFFTDDDTLIMNADVFAEECVYDHLMATSKNPILAFDSSKKEEADYKLYCPNGVIEKLGKELTGADISGEYVGLAVLRRDYISKFVKQMEKMIDVQKHGLWWENVLYELAATEAIYVDDISGMFWAEVDYIEDYQRIRDYVAAQK